MNDNIRLFVAASLPENVKSYLVQAREAYTGPAIRQVPEQNLHLTLYFIGNVPMTEDTYIRQTLMQVAQRHSRFTLSLEQLEPGPKPRSPRLIWARFSQNEAFSKLSQELTQALSPAPPKQEKFIPHVTLSRFKKEGAVPKDLPLITPPSEVLYPVSSFALWQSQLASPHPIYTIVEEFPLTHP
ncbi:RNA 2',3'-cyclic phosphodiesterase [Rufibacter latericius]|uniref:RNA 2',3'-cyclic phosphodiesterase n=1 Tax=Rufibacter latericius TaxID=2487040 RepID=A0A3M9MYE4_9BACT|nr:RNA 2',3'-cyclic phosphodiesterase [Rufibacter latericius]RNI30572.1 RNA 2',3'-cyclic phosphodiesterase [Rufibacter latericius]